MRGDPDVDGMKRETNASRGETRENMGRGEARGRGGARGGGRTSGDLWLVCRASSSNALVSAERFLPEFSCLGSAGASPRSASAAPSFRGETGMTTATARARDDRLRAGGFGREPLRGLGWSVGGSA